MGWFGKRAQRWCRRLVNLVLVELVRCSRVFRVVGFDDTRYVSVKHAAVWCARQEEEGGRENGSSPSSVGGWRVVQPWCTPAGDVNGEMCGALTRGVLARVTQSPGITLDNLVAGFPVLQPQQVRVFLEVLIAEGRVVERTMASVSSSRGSIFGSSSKPAAPSCASYFFPSLLKPA